MREKGGDSVYGLGRFPVTLYKEQWRTLLDMATQKDGRVNRISSYRTHARRKLAIGGPFA